MNISDLLKQNPAKTWMWVAIFMFCLLFMQTCSKCSHKQNAMFAEKNNIEMIEELKVENQHLQDSILIIQGNLQTCSKSNQDLQNENDHLRDALKQSQEKPVIIWKEINTNK